MDENDKTIATSVDSFEPSLWHFVDQIKSKYALISLVDQITNDRMEGFEPEYPVVLLTGIQGSGRRTLARSLHFALGNLQFKEAALVLGTSEDPIEFFEKSSEYTTFYIPNFPKVSPTVAGQLVHIVRDNFFYKSFPMKSTQVIPIKNRLIILSSDCDAIIHPDILKHVGIRCDLTSYSTEHIHKIVRQRVDYLGWDASENTIELISENSDNNPGKAIKMLQQTYVIMRAENMNNRKINVTHAKKALVLCTK